MSAQLAEAIYRANDPELSAGTGLMDIELAPDPNRITEPNVLCRNRYPALSKDFYKAKSVSFSYETDNTMGTAYILTVIILSDESGEMMISREYAVRPLALNQYALSD